MSSTSKILSESFELAGGVSIPKLGLGTWLLDDKGTEAAVAAALKAGYRHIDTAQAYQNEAAVGRAVRASGLPRNEVFVTSKLAAEHKTTEAAREAIDGSLKELGVEHIDLMLIHAPQPWAAFGGDDRCEDGNVAAWRALEEALDAGKVRAIGVSNFTRADLAHLLGEARVPPAVNQLLVHIGETPHELLEFCAAHNVLVEAYSPVGHGALLRNEQLGKIAAKYGASVPQLAIRYTLQLGAVSLPKSGDAAHIADNAKVDFEISDEDMETLRKFERVADYGDAAKFPVYSTNATTKDTGALSDELAQKAKAAVDKQTK